MALTKEEIKGLKKETKKRLRNGDLVCKDIVIDDEKKRMVLIKKTKETK